MGLGMRADFGDALTGGSGVAGGSDKSGGWDGVVEAELLGMASLGGAGRVRR